MTCKREGLTPVPDLNVLALDCREHGLVGLIPSGGRPSEYELAERAFKEHERAVHNGNPVLQFRMNAGAGLLLSPVAISLLTSRTSWPILIDFDQRQRAHATLSEIGIGLRKREDVIRLVVNPLLDIIATLHAQLDIEEDKGRENSA
jgi:hypothetical protein